MTTARPKQGVLYRILQVKTTSQNVYFHLNGDTGAVELKPLDTGKNSKKQTWKLSPTTEDEWKIENEDNGSILTSNGDRVVTVQNSYDSQSTWALSVEDGIASFNRGEKTLIVDRSNLLLSSDDSKKALLMFDPVRKSDGGATRHRRGFQEQFFTFTPQMAEADQEGYDIIIIGTGIGGGVLASDLYDTNHKIGSEAKKILVLEKGDLVFHSHCLNASRPSGLNEDRGQQNDTFFEAFKSSYKLVPETKDWKGGPMHCLGGRSAAWGLFAPRVHDMTLKTRFPPAVMKDLVDTYYKKAEKIMNLSLPVTKPHHQHLIDRLNVDGSKHQVNWQWGRIASEFSDTRNFDFAEGAYSTIDRLLEIAMSKPAEGEYHKNFKILLGVEARRINWKSDNKTADSVSAVSWEGSFTFRLKPKGRVIVCAGSVASPAILMRSGLSRDSMGGCHLTDHDILYKAKSFRYIEPSDRKDVGAVKLQTFAQVGANETDIALVNMSLDASTFLPRSKTPFDDLPKFIIVFILWAPLVDSKVELVNDEPEVTIGRYKPEKKIVDSELMNKKMNELTTKWMATIGQVLNVKFLDDSPSNNTPQRGDDQEFKKLQLGGVAHELGTIPMPGISGQRHALDQDLKLKNYEGVYVCDLSVFPYSPEANPTLTLAALAVRLSRTLVKRRTIEKLAPSVVYVVNHSGSPVKVFVSNRQEQVIGTRTVSSNKEQVLMQGDEGSWRRRADCAESVSVFKLDPRVKTSHLRDPKDLDFSLVPEVMVAHPGKVLAIR
jgi:choline dehydrogenase-like flavoprotein